MPGTSHRHLAAVGRLCPHTVASDNKPDHACFTTCVTNRHKHSCTTTCSDCDETKDLEYINTLSLDSLITNETSLAMMYALRPKETTAGMDTKDEGEGGVAEDAHRPVRGANRSSSPVQIFLDSGCIAGNYIR